MKARLAVLVASVALLLLAAGNGAWARSAPDFTLLDQDGNSLTLSSFRGKLVVLEFLQPACPHCQKAGKLLQKLYEEFAGRDFMVIGISHDPRGLPAIREYRKEHGLTYPIVFGDMVVAMNYLGINPLRPNFHVPVFFFISPTGEILEERNPEHLLDKDWFANTEQNLEATVRRLMPPPAKPAAKGRKRGASPPSPPRAANPRRPALRDQGAHLRQP